MYKKSILILFILLSLLLISSCSKQQINNSLTFDKSYYVSRVVDGDTIKIYDNGEEISVRLIGIDTPETHSGDKPLGELGDKAYWFTRNKIYTENAKKSYVYLDFDNEKYGNYDRLLAYVYYKGKDGKMHFLNKEIMENGYARPLFYSDTSKHKDDFIEAYKKAFQDRKGIFKYFDDSSRIIEDINLTDEDIGKIRNVKFKVANVISSGSFYKIYSDSDRFYISIRRDEYNAFFNNLNLFDLKGKEIMIYGEIWKENGKYEILARAEFEIKILE
ncbi:thermonuclease family protein [Marinitoga litoralis]|uniref:thermonuclease family protein n=1 Tax=Marinitoga litoralis TaxID=570855 RepID=UPI0019604638|nr:thermonuclease family protein [Marinitoga litoralis]MBM7559555.1 micrococcal nuclease [Marinitoga litoralis]